MVDWRNGLAPRALTTLRGVGRCLLAMQALQAVVFVQVGLSWRATPPVSRMP